MNELNDWDSVLMKACYLLPDLETIIQQLIHHQIENNVLSKSELDITVSANIQKNGINLVVDSNQNFWEPGMMKDGFFNEDESCYFLLKQMTRGIKVISKPKGFNAFWFCEYPFPFPHDNEIHKINHKNPHEDLCESKNHKINHNSYHGEEKHNSYHGEVKYNSYHGEVKYNSYHGDSDSIRGLVISIDSLFHNIPVRKKYLLNNMTIIDLEKNFRNMIFYFNNIWPEVNITLKIVFLNDSFILTSPTKISSSIPLCLQENFQNLFMRKERLDSLCCQKIKLDHKLYTIQGFISSKGYPTEQYQFFYYNEKELLLDKKWRSLFFNGKFNNVYGFNSNDNLTKTVGNSHRKYPVIVLRIMTKKEGQNLDDLDAESLSFRYSRYVCLKKEDTISMISFGRQNWSRGRVLLILEKLIESFIKNLNPSSENIDITFKKKINHFTAKKNITKFNKGIKRSDIFSYYEENEEKDEHGDDLQEVHDYINGRKKMRLEYDLDHKPPLTHNCNISSSNKYKFLQEDKYELFAKDLIHCEVIAQLEKKFILTKLSENYILIFDQHAADERIKLESFLHKYIISCLNKKLKLRKLETPFIIQSVSKNEMSLLEKHHDSLLFLGIHLVKENDTSVSIQEIPDFLAIKIQQDYNFLINSIWKYIWELEENLKKTIDPTKINENDWWFVVSNLPTIIVDIFNSKACRQAVMFGDELTLDQCKIIITSLYKCNMPFYCAHGRPSLYPFNYEKRKKKVDLFLDDYLL
ncbi:hypothetical protein HANVADRAFT_47590 [Hanseniaspora valbyensis NRRL Y-1626]|uniref:MutL C-terminal dimerisation domain-containing protein n=1 Tax=Hanseniaspora valbyensis NRRL Y-1626 TaxID=766949 RepID=A0A1B7TH00_9ASCO|nr:hypothetical protein HANVADRAFT_47590 [Hanseniaspora valbyensis NRRL Y-1626]